MHSLILPLCSRSRKSKDLWLCLDAKVLGNQHTTLIYQHHQPQRYHPKIQFETHSHQPLIKKKVGHKLPERRLSLSTSRRLGGYAHVGDAIPHTHIHTSNHSISTKPHHKSKLH